MERKIRPLTIFEGPDCAGKSTLVSNFRKRRSEDAVILHHGPYKGIDEKQLPRMYVELMLPMLHGYQEQIWDRCWMSELIYGPVYRDANRVSMVALRHLNRIALRHGIVYVMCLPPWEKVEEQWIKRKADGGEMLDDTTQLRAIYDRYRSVIKEIALLYTDEPVVWWDYTIHNEEALFRKIEKVRPTLHKDLHIKTCGNLDARTLLVGDEPSVPKNEDATIQFPFSSFSGSGSSAWLTQMLMNNGIREVDLCWVNACDGVHWIRDRHFDKVIALGDRAANALATAGIPHQKTTHPQYHRRFKSDEPYDLINIIKE